MRVPRTRKAWSLPFGLATGALGFWGGHAIVNIVLPKSNDPSSNSWAQVAMLFVVGTALKYLYRWYLSAPPERPASPVR
jgi:hypothetical protein